MNGTSSARQIPPLQRYPARVKLILRVLAQIKHGALHLQLPDGEAMHFGDDSYPITLHLHDWKMFDAVMKSGDIGFAETFIDGGWTTDNLTGLIELFIRNRQQVEALIYGTWWGSLLHRVRHLFNRNSRSGSRKNIHAHYDIGNDFYRLWLDPSMTYSSAVFNNGTSDSLEQGQHVKYQRILNQLNVAKGAHILEIGCGWGGFAETAIREAQATVHGLTLSTEQLHYAQQRLANLGMATQADLRLMDYRDSDGRYDAIASIEMFEAVGEAYWPSYFECIARNLKQGGRACVQTIVISDELFARYRTGTDFIQQYIFPGGMLPSPSVFREHAQKQGLRVLDEFSFGLDYARTLVEWRSAFKDQLEAVRAQGFDERFLRTWEFYLCYCEAGFRAHSINVMQFTLEK
ncbi:MAG: SAM-dependent methyltransferase [Sideroxydans sp.]|nr:SAM-dependent methyltransferase [Sideroxydans sp.]